MDFELTLITAYSHMTFKYFPDILPFVGDCAGSEGAAVFGCALLTSYLGLFINFYLKTYKRPVSFPKSDKLVNGKANR